MLLQDQDILDRVAGVLQLSGRADLPSFWTTVVADCHLRGYWAMVGALAARGYTLAQILAWDRAAEVEADLSLFFTLSKGASLARVDAELLKSYDRRDELTGTKDVPAVVVTASGVVTVPAGTAGQPQTGAVDAADDGELLHPPSVGRRDDVGFGDELRW